MGDDIFDKSVINYNNLITLQKTTKITLEDVALSPLWGKLLNRYKNTENGVDEAVTSILNSVLTQNRLCFIMTRESLKKLVQTDRNHKKFGNDWGFSNKSYAKILSVLYQDKFCIAIGNHVKSKARGFELIHIGAEQYIASDKSYQMQQVLEYIENNKKTRY